MSRKNQICTLNLSSPVPALREEAESAVCTTRKRLAEAFAYLERLERQRAHGRVLMFGRLMEQRIIWRELLELELQDANEGIERVSGVALKKPG